MSLLSIFCGCFRCALYCTSAWSGFLCSITLTCPVQVLDALPRDLQHALASLEAKDSTMMHQEFKNVQKRSLNCVWNLVAEDNESARGMHCWLDQWAPEHDVAWATDKLQTEVQEELKGFALGLDLSLLQSKGRRYLHIFAQLVVLPLPCTMAHGGQLVSNSILSTNCVSGSLMHLDSLQYLINPLNCINVAVKLTWLRCIKC